MASHHSLLFVLFVLSQQKDATRLQDSEATKEGSGETLNKRQPVP